MRYPLDSYRFVGSDQHHSSSTRHPSYADWRDWRLLVAPGCRALAAAVWYFTSGRTGTRF